MYRQENKEYTKDKYKGKQRTLVNVWLVYLADLATLVWSGLGTSRLQILYMSYVIREGGEVTDYTFL